MPRLSFLFSLAALAAGLPLSSGAQGLGNSSATGGDALARAAIETADRSYANAFADADVEALVSLHDSAATELVGQGRVIGGRAALTEYWADWIKTHGKSRRTQLMTGFWPLGDRAFETGKYTTVYKSPQGDDIAVSGNYAIEWRHEPDGTWKIRTQFDTAK